MADVKKVATREAYGKALAQFGDKYDIVVLDADLSKSTKTFGCVSINKNGGIDN